MSVLCKINNEQFVYSKGAFEYLIKKCKYIERDGKIRILKEKIKMILLKIIL
jgi:magnesium-transporting ATPase (P-type)